MDVVYGAPLTINSDFTHCKVKMHSSRRQTEEDIQGRTENIIIIIIAIKVKTPFADRWGVLDGDGVGAEGRGVRYSRIVKSITWDAKQKTGCSYISLFLPTEREGGDRGHADKAGGQRHWFGSQGAKVSAVQMLVWRGSHVEKHTQLGTEIASSRRVTVDMLAYCIWLWGSLQKGAGRISGKKGFGGELI